MQRGLIITAEEGMHPAQDYQKYDVLVINGEDWSIKNRINGPTYVTFGCDNQHGESLLLQVRYDRTLKGVIVDTDSAY